MNSSLYLRVNIEEEEEKENIEQSMVKKLPFTFYVSSPPVTKIIKEHRIMLELIITTVDIDNFFLFHRVLSICCLSARKNFISFEQPSLTAV